MSNEQQHINPWTDKLQQAPLPDIDASWKGMERLLDQHMPVEGKEKKPRFFFLPFTVLFLLIGAALWIGYLNFIPQQHVKQQNQTANRNKTDTPASGIATSVTQDEKLSPTKETTSTAQQGSHIHAADTTINNDTAVEHFQPETGTANDKVVDAVKTTPSTNTRLFDSRGTTHAATSTAGNAVNIPAKSKTSINRQPIKVDTDNRSIVKKKNGKASGRSTALLPTSSTVASASEKTKKIQSKRSTLPDENDSTSTLDAVINAASPRSARISMLPPFRRLLLPPLRLIIKDSAGQLQGSAFSDSVKQILKKKRGEEQKKGWTFNVGVNHFMRISNQQSAPYKGDAKNPDSEGLTGKIVDYLPVPQARYHFNNKLFVQGELQFNAPQFTQPVQLDHRNYRDGFFDVSDTAYLKKLTYFNLPLSIHYSPLKRVFIGVGVQSSRLTNAIVLYEKTSKSINSPFPDSTLKASKQVQIKSDTLFQKLYTHEFRLLGDVSYQAGPFTLGARYNHALRGLVKVPVANAAFTQTRNSSLQLFIRYRFLDKRKRIQPKSK